MLYDPPSGWQFGFPKTWPEGLQRNAKNLAIQLIKDGYPIEDIAFAVRHTRFIGAHK